MILFTPDGEPFGEVEDYGIVIPEGHVFDIMELGISQTSKRSKHLVPGDWVDFSFNKKDVVYRGKIAEIVEAVENAWDWKDTFHLIDCEYLAPRDRPRPFPKQSIYRESCRGASYWYAKILDETPLRNIELSKSWNTLAAELVS